MEARSRLKDQEVFYALIEGKHAATDDIVKGEWSYPHLIQLYRHNNKALVEFIRGYNDASREYRSGNEAASNWSRDGGRLRGVRGASVKLVQPS